MPPIFFNSTCVGIQKNTCTAPQMDLKLSLATTTLNYYQKSRVTNYLYTSSVKIVNLAHKAILLRL